MIFPQLSESSRVWIYAADRELTQEEQKMIRPVIQEFIGQWAAHGNQLFGAGDVLHDRFIVFAVDEAMVPASGCSIDTSVRFIKDLEKTYQVNLLDRMNVWIEDNGKMEKVHFSELTDHKDAMIFDPMVKTLGDLRNKWHTPIRDTSYL